MTGTFPLERATISLHLQLHLQITLSSQSLYHVEASAMIC